MAKAVGDRPGPAWSGGYGQLFAGRFPLAVESYPMRQVAALLPGVTTVTPHARYFALHAFLATRFSGLPVSEARELLRRSEVVFSAISSLHMQETPELHDRMSLPHGHDKITAQMLDGVLPVTDLAAPKRYAQAQNGFLGPYLGSERLLGLIVDAGAFYAAGPVAREAPLERAFAGLPDLAQRDHIPIDELRRHTHLCLCMHTAPERAWLRRILVPPDAAPATPGGHRAQTALLLTRLIALHGPANITRDLDHKLVSDPDTYSDPRVRDLEVVDAWRGVVLRSWYAWAARDLWAWMVNDHLPSAMAVSTLASQLGDTLGHRGTLRTFLGELPPAMCQGQPTDAEFSDPVERLDDGARQFAQLCLGAQRHGHLPDHVAPYFTDTTAERRNYQLTPPWMHDYLDDRLDRDVRLVADELARLIVERSQRVAAAKARVVKGRWRIPTRVTVRDGIAFPTSEEPGGPISLRWNQLTQVMCGLGLVRWTRDPGGGRWSLTEEGDAYCA